MCLRNNDKRQDDPGGPFRQKVQLTILKMTCYVPFRVAPDFCIKNSGEVCRAIQCCHGIMEIVQVQPEVIIPHRHHLPTEQVHVIQIL